MLTEIKPFFDWLSLHPHWAHFITFAVAFIECFIVLGLLVPGTIMMAAIGTLIGMGVVPFTGIVLSAIAGAILGDVISFWLGYHFHQQIRDFWPFRSHPKLLIKGEQFFNRHGGKGVFFGRFVGPVRPILPVIAGMMSMTPARFLTADITSAILWAPLYMSPGILIGAASQQLPPEIATKLILVIVGIIVLFSLISWLVQRTYAWFSKILDNQIAWLWQFTEKHPRLISLRSLLMDPQDPYSHSQLALAIGLIVLIISFFTLSYSVIQHGFFTQLNDPLNYFLRGIRTTVADKFFVAVTLINSSVLSVMWVAVTVWLLLKRYWHAAFYWLAVGTMSVVSCTLLKHFIHSVRPSGLMHTPDGFSFPSGHTTSSVALLGFLAVLLNRLRPVHWRWISYIIVSLIAGSIIISRLYLGAHWLSDVIGGILLGSICIALGTLFYRRKPTKKLDSKGILIVATLSLIMSWGWSFHKHYQKSLDDYRPFWQPKILNLQDWWNHAEQNNPIYRTNRFGRPIEMINLQWAGNLPEIHHALKKQGWHDLPKNALLRALNNLTNKDRKQQLPILSQLYEDRKPVLIMTKVVEELNTLLIIRLWDAHLSLDSDTPIWLGSVEYYHARRSHNHSVIQTYLSSTNLLLKDLNSFNYKQVNYPNINSDNKLNTVLFIK